MELLYRPLPMPLAIAGFIGLLPLTLLAALRALPSLLRAPALQQHAFLAVAIGCGFLWSLQIEASGARFSMLGAPLAALLLGRDRALLALLAALTGHLALAGGAWTNVGVLGLLLAAVPAWLMPFLQRQIERRLPPNLFVFIIGNGLAATLATLACMTLALRGLAALTIAPALQDDTLAYALLLSWAEALVSGMIFSSLVIFIPDVVVTYRQDVYLPRGGH
ncbi:MAG: energy-coupling factor ABC transporter permease [Sutterellaceae bacterium]|nr:hypothetical protein [Burkholderiaceae bacterium]MDW8431004.1 energy-coupling factor ABC transporter permease [Sutterellaceae bacterium]